MGMSFLQFLDYFFLLFHTILVLFNLFGWIFKKTRKWNLALLLVTAFSWIVMGYWYGLGYCFCTDWHWQVRQKLGHNNMPNSYIKFLADFITGLDLNATLVDVCTGLAFFTALACSIYVNYRDARGPAA